MNATQLDNLTDALRNHLSPEAVAVIASTLFSHGWTNCKGDDEADINSEVMAFADACVVTLGGSHGYELTCRELGI